VNTFEITIQRRVDDVWTVGAEPSRTGVFLPVRSEGTSVCNLYESGVSTEMHDCPDTGLV
jgi:hypothetical protein